MSFRPVLPVRGESANAEGGKTHASRLGLVRPSIVPLRTASFWLTRHPRLGAIGMSRRADTAIPYRYRNPDPLAGLLILVWRVTLTRHRRLDEFRLFAGTGIHPLPLTNAAFVGKT